MQRRQLSCLHFQTKKDKAMIIKYLIQKKTKVKIKKASQGHFKSKVEAEQNVTIQSCQVITFLVLLSFGSREE